MDVRVDRLGDENVGGHLAQGMEQTSFRPLLLFLFSAEEIRSEDLFHVRFVDSQLPHFLP